MVITYSLWYSQEFDNFEIKFTINLPHISTPLKSIGFLQICGKFWDTQKIKSGQVNDRGPVFEIRSDPDLVCKIWSEMDLV